MMKNDPNRETQCWVKPSTNDREDAFVLGAEEPTSETLADAMKRLWKRAIVKCEGADQGTRWGALLDLVQECYEPKHGSDDARRARMRASIRLKEFLAKAK